MTKPKTIIVDGVEYVEKQRVEKDYVIVRTKDAGVHAGNLITKEGDEVQLANARRIWYWVGAASLSQLAVDGVTKPKECKFPCEVLQTTILGVIEITPCTEKAMNSIKGVPIWEIE